MNSGLIISWSRRVDSACHVLCCCKRICPGNPLLMNNGPHTVGTWHCESDRENERSRGSVRERKKKRGGEQAWRVPAIAAHRRGSVVNTVPLFAPVWLMFDVCGWATLFDRCFCVLMWGCPMPLCREAQQPFYLISIHMLFQRFSSYEICNLNYFVCKKQYIFHLFYRTVQTCFLEWYLIHILLLCNKWIWLWVSA